MAAADLNHSPPEIARKLCIDKGWGAEATDASYTGGGSTALPLKYKGAAWPVFANGEPEMPDSCLMWFPAASRVHGRDHVEGVTHEHFGVQLTVRAARESAGWVKARALANSLDRETTLVNVTIDGSTYLVYSIGRTTGVLSLGKDDASTSKRRYYTIEALMAVIMLP